MKRIRTILFVVSACLVLVGAVLYLTHWVAAPYLFAVGSAGIAVNYLTTPVGDLDFRSRRLHRFNVMAGFLMVVASGFQFNGRKEWVICLLIAAILQLYTAFVSPKKE
ncbi:MAG: hypothetical protein ACI3ZY_07760 [Parabacteroides sp.]